LARRELQPLNLQDKNTTNRDQELEIVLAKLSILGELGRADLEEFERLVKGCSF